MDVVLPEEQQKLTTEERMDALFYQFVKLYERWAEDRQVAAKQGFDIAKLVEIFTAEVDKFASIEDAVISKLRKSLHETVLNLAEEVKIATTETINTTLELSAKKMHASALVVEKILAENKKARWLSTVKIIAVSTFCSLVISSSLMWHFMPKPTLPLTQRDINIYMLGKRFVNLWPTLSKEKQEWFFSITKNHNEKELKEIYDKKY